ncbi:MAG: nucleotidyl transferase AbiEii/AbiGii toxin family protein [Kiritimatiellia bacterium]|nr:nucleotidyl transferase AbiEii/AbiGii toxin family protein [Kiritimatiellia bacterium]
MDRIARAPPLDRADLFRRAALASGPAWLPAIMEKDFWVCWTLRRMFDVLRVRPQLIFKGGTSLSKVYNAIERFSEDVDLSLSRRDLGFADDRDPEQPGISKKEARRRLNALVDECQRVIRERLLPELRADFSTVISGEGWAVELDAADPQTVLFTYPKSDMDYGLGTYIRPMVRLEFGARSDDWPAVDNEIKPYAAAVFPAVFTAAPVCRVHRFRTCPNNCWPVRC